MDKDKLSALVGSRFKEVEYTANMADAFADAYSTLGRIDKVALRDYIGTNRFLFGTNCREVSDPMITQGLLVEADEYLAKAVSNLCAGCRSMQQGYLSWGEVTTYYASFFAIHGLLRLQGKALGIGYALFPRTMRSPASVLKHGYYVVKRPGGNGIHEDVWRKFSDTYSQNTDIDQRQYGDAIFFSGEQDVVLEVERRNRFNYHMFQSYSEIFDVEELRRRDLFRLQSMAPPFFSRLTDYLMDRDRRYVAKAALRIRLLHGLLYSIVEDVAGLKSYFVERHGRRIAFLDSVIDANDPISRAAIESSCLTLP